MTKARHEVKPRLLLIEPDAACRRVLRAALVRAAPRAEVLEADVLAAGLAVARHCHGVYLAGGSAGDIARLRAGGFSGGLMAALEDGSLARAVAAVKAGADDVCVKPVRADDAAQRLLAAVAAPAQTAPARTPAVAATPAAEAPSGLIPAEALPHPGEAHQEPARDFAGFIGRAPAMRRLYDQIARIAPSQAPVFITGESGTGKELAARALHDLGPRAKAPFVALNCGAIPRDLLESEVFGHVRGAFTGAHQDRLGAAESADGGTLFLDEIGEMDAALQAKLLRFLQEGTVRRIGESAERRIDVRIVCATHRDPAREVAAGRLREDLYFRLCVLPLALPPLRERGEDAALLASAFLARYARDEGRDPLHLTPEAAALLCRQPWRGNVREVQNLMRRAVVLAEPPFLDENTLRALGLGQAAPAAPPQGAAQIEPYEVAERRLLEAALSACDGNIARAAAALRLSPSTLYRKKLAWTATPQGAELIAL